MQNLKELNTAPIKKKQEYYLEKEFPFNENNKELIRNKANKFSFNKSIVERDMKFHLEKTENSFKVNYRNKKAEMLR